MDMSGVPRNAISRAFFSAPDGLLDLKDGTMNNHQNQYPSTLMEISLRCVQISIGFKSQKPTLPHHLHVVGVKPAESSKKRTWICCHNVTDTQTNDSLSNKNVFQPISEHTAPFNGQIILLLHNLGSDFLCFVSTATSVTFSSSQPNNIHVTITRQRGKLKSQVEQISFQIDDLYWKEQMRQRNEFARQVILRIAQTFAGFSRSSKPNP